MTMLQTVREHQLYAKLEKCKFFKTKIQYLGHVISKEGIVVDPKKVQAISDWPVPKDVAYVWSFIEGFSKIAYPIRSLWVLHCFNVDISLRAYVWF